MPVLATRRSLPSLLTVTLLLAGPTGCVAPEAVLDGDTCDGHGDGDAPEIGRAVEPLSSVSCEERSDTGYTRGEAFSIDVVTVDGKPVEVATADAYMVMAEAAARDGVELRIVSGFRTMAEQEYLYGCYTSCSCNGCNLAARPGYSNHQSGHALDLNTSAGGVLAWLEAHGAAFGFSRTVPSEAWHWEWWGGGPGGGPCGRPEPPAPGACPALGPDGGEIEETSGCFYAHGPSRYWRSESVGHGGALLWTNAFTATAPSNWARWYVEASAAADYAVELWAEPGFAVHRAARYVVRHAGREETVTVDLSSGSGWLALGTFRFEAGADQHVSVYDDVTGAVAADQHIPADAIRLVRAPEPPPPPADPPPAEPPSEPGSPEPGSPEPGPSDPVVGAPDAGPPPAAAPARTPPETATGSAAELDGKEPLRGGCSAAGGGAPISGSGTLGVVLLLAAALVVVARRRR